eukprot:CAMPEP_0178401802 /NCGR_PEP_ID=MMETSP0689_2-20121128/16494_1 /TAXON_ID=160604 /ORGANISM="Amphidinium massartii, Strain CS-259" /LENGTH=154 /DNA_ID=CAMNT_0020022643 /DNA_START=93 /DNA_END=554 /DNA_ORIENTATION=-
MGQQAPGAQFGLSPARHSALKHLTTGPGALHVEGADSHCSMAKPVALYAVTTWRSTAISWSGAQQRPQQVPSTFMIIGAGQLYSPHWIAVHGGVNTLLPELSFMRYSMSSAVSSGVSLLRMVMPEQAVARAKAVTAMTFSCIVAGSTGEGATSL